MELKDEAHAIAVVLGKSENMRVTAGRMFADLWKYVTTPSTDGAQQLSNAGYRITQQGLWEMITTDPSYPHQIGTSWGTGKRVLAIGRAADPVEADRAERAARAQADALRAALTRKQDAMSPLHSFSEPETDCTSTPLSPGSSLDAIMAAVKSLPLADFETFKQWFREYCGT